MAYLVRKTVEEFMYAGAKAIKECRVLSVGASFHVDTTPSNVTGSFKNPTAVALSSTIAAATDLPSLIALLGQLDKVYATMIADDNAHKVADIADTMAGFPISAVIDLPSSIAYANQMKAQFNLHCVSTTYHYNADTVIATANGTILADTITLANAIQTKLNSHIASAPAGNGIKLQGP